MIIEKIRADKNDNFGFNAATEKFEDLVAAGVIDPAKVTRYALQNAASIAGLMLTTEAMIADAPDEKGGYSLGQARHAHHDRGRKLQSDIGTRDDNSYV